MPVSVPQRASMKKWVFILAAKTPPLQERKLSEGLAWCYASRYREADFTFFLAVFALCFFFSLRSVWRTHRSPLFSPTVMEKNGWARETGKRFIDPHEIPINRNQWEYSLPATSEELRCAATSSHKAEHVDNRNKLSVIVLRKCFICIPKPYSVFKLQLFSIILVLELNIFTAFFSK